MKGESASTDPTRDPERRIAMFRELRERWAKEVESPKHSSHERSQKAYRYAFEGLKALLPDGATDGWEGNMNPSEIVEALDKAIEDIEKEEGSRGGE